MFQKVREVAKGKKYAIGFHNGRVCVTDMPMTGLENRYRQGLNTSVENEICICIKLLAAATDDANEHNMVENPNQQEADQWLCWLITPISLREPRMSST